MKLIVGLGNPGQQYAHTRHNLGFMVVSELAERLHADSWRTTSKFSAAIAEAGDLLFVQPHTMMNLSGAAIQKLAHFYKIDSDDIWVLFDDVDTPFGRLRIRRGGTGSGHQGVNSAIQHIGPNFVRAKLGISLNDRTREPSEIYVLKPFNPDEREQLPQLIAEAATVLMEQIALPEPTETTFDLLTP